MSYIIAHIKINPDKTYSVDILDNEPNAKTGLEDMIESGETDFYIKIQVDPCINMLNDCFGLSNGKSYRLDFDNADFDNRVPIDAFLADGPASNGPASNASPNARPNASPLVKGPLAEFKALIETELSKISSKQNGLADFKSIIVEKLREVGKLDIFKKLIVKELETVETKP
jgi:hypothetical protein